jgi:hypothetical protein
MLSIGEQLVLLMYGTSLLSVPFLIGICIYFAFCGGRQSKSSDVSIEPHNID